MIRNVPLRLKKPQPPTRSVAPMRAAECPDSGEIICFLMQVAAGDLDLEIFNELSKRGADALAAGDWAAAESELSAALALWRGNPLADVTSSLLQMTEVPRLAELRLQAVESRVDADMRLGRHAGLVAELRQLAAAQPLREQFHGQLMLALYRCGRQAEARAGTAAGRARLTSPCRPTSATSPGSPIRNGWPGTCTGRTPTCQAPASTRARRSLT